MRAYGYTGPTLSVVEPGTWPILRHGVSIRSGFDRNGTDLLPAVTHALIEDRQLDYQRDVYHWLVGAIIMLISSYEFILVFLLPALLGYFGLLLRKQVCRTVWLIDIADLKRRRQKVLV
jgi:hypothetical protein